MAEGAALSKYAESNDDDLDNDFDLGPGNSRSIPRGASFGGIEDSTTDFDSEFKVGPGTVGSLNVLRVEVDDHDNDADGFEADFDGDGSIKLKISSELDTNSNDEDEDWDQEFNITVTPQDMRNTLRQNLNQTIVEQKDDRYGLPKKHILNITFEHEDTESSPSRRMPTVPWNATTHSSQTFTTYDEEISWIAESVNFAYDSGKTLRDAAWTVLDETTIIESNAAIKIFVDEAFPDSPQQIHALYAIFDSFRDDNHIGGGGNDDLADPYVDAVTEGEGTKFALTIILDHLRKYADDRREESMEWAIVSIELNLHRSMLMNDWEVGKALLVNLCTHYQHCDQSTADGARNAFVILSNIQLALQDVSPIGGQAVVHRSGHVADNLGLDSTASGRASSVPHLDLVIGTDIEVLVRGEYRITCLKALYEKVDRSSIETIRGLLAMALHEWYDKNDPQTAERMLMQAINVANAVMAHDEEAERDTDLLVSIQQHHLYSSQMCASILIAFGNVLYINRKDTLGLAAFEGAMKIYSSLRHDIEPWLRRLAVLSAESGDASRSLGYYMGILDGMKKASKVNEIMHVSLLASRTLAERGFSTMAEAILVDALEFLPSVQQPVRRNRADPIETTLKMRLAQVCVLGGKEHQGIRILQSLLEQKMPAKSKLSTVLALANALMKRGWYADARVLLQAHEIPVRKKGGIGGSPAIDRARRTRPTSMTTTAVDAFDTGDGLSAIPKTTGHLHSWLQTRTRQVMAGFGADDISLMVKSTKYWMLLAKARYRQRDYFMARDAIVTAIGVTQNPGLSAITSASYLMARIAADCVHWHTPIDFPLHLAKDDGKRATGATGVIRDSTPISKKSASKQSLFAKMPKSFACNFELTQCAIDQFAAAREGYARLGDDIMSLKCWTLLADVIACSLFPPIVMDKISLERFSGTADMLEFHRGWLKDGIDSASLALELAVDKCLPFYVLHNYVNLAELNKIHGDEWKSQQYTLLFCNKFLLYFYNGEDITVASMSRSKLRKIEELLGRVCRLIAVSPPAIIEDHFLFFLLYQDANRAFRTSHLHLSRWNDEAGISDVASQLSSGSLGPRSQHGTTSSRRSQVPDILSELSNKTDSARSRNTTFLDAIRGNTLESSKARPALPEEFRGEDSPTTPDSSATPTRLDEDSGRSILRPSRTLGSGGHITSITDFVTAVDGSMEFFRAQWHRLKGNCKAFTKGEIPSNRDLKKRNREIIHRITGHMEELRSTKLLSSPMWTKVGAKAPPGSKLTITDSDGEFYEPVSLSRLREDLPVLKRTVITIQLDGHLVVVNLGDGSVAYTKMGGREYIDVKTVHRSTSGNLSASLWPNDMVTRVQIAMAANSNMTCLIDVSRQATVAETINAACGKDHDKKLFCSHTWEVATKTDQLSKMDLSHVSKFNGRSKAFEQIAKTKKIGEVFDIGEQANSPVKPLVLVIGPTESIGKSQAVSLRLIEMRGFGPRTSSLVSTPELIRLLNYTTETTFHVSEKETGAENSAHILSLQLAPLVNQINRIPGGRFALWHDPSVKAEVGGKKSLFASLLGNVFRSADSAAGRDSPRASAGSLTDANAVHIVCCHTSGLIPWESILEVMCVRWRSLLDLHRREETTAGDHSETRDGEVMRNLLHPCFLCPYHSNDVIEQTVPRSIVERERRSLMLNESLVHLGAISRYSNYDENNTNADLFCGGMVKKPGKMSLARRRLKNGALIDMSVSNYAIAIRDQLSDLFTGPVGPYIIVLTYNDLQQLTDSLVDQIVAAVLPNHTAPHAVPIYALFTTASGQRRILAGFKPSQKADMLDTADLQRLYRDPALYSAYLLDLVQGILGGAIPPVSVVPLVQRRTRIAVDRGSETLE
eukprot:Clim_evm116s157 gene=Clim_evmTU116s157